MMNEKEIKSLCSQLAYTHSANRNASFPFSLIFSSVNGRTYQRLESLSDASYKRWANTHWWPEGYDQLWKGNALPSSNETPSIEGNLAQPERGNSSEIDSKEEQKDVVDSGPSSFGKAVGTSATKSAPKSLSVAQDKVIYLTADTEDELTELKPDEVYIIGGICDHNRYKNLCLNKAKESGVRTARLPIGRYLASLPTRKVLTVNQVFEILVKWVETKDWEESLYAVIPKRKFQPGKKGNHDTNIDATAVEDDAEADETAQQDAEDEDS
ncbi:guanine-1-methyltransferase-domain-containing protein [Gymnopilus junonius]|uniref:tRNA (guanine(9)-N1)-methyltransferase n=1 Tax=Gymnopilus junonius TaxID=109634 RepID=A0A9P5P3K6_GYMJU|nr:guanine-1-methyltransferase-domain-containing protein [Gymnopilus junonius]